MSPFDDFDDESAAEIPDDVVEELIRGAFEPELPTELVLVGRVLRAAYGPIPGEDPAREAEVVEAMVAAMRVTPISAARSSIRKRGRRRALVALTAAVSVLGIGGVAAAAGGLPTPIQSFVHDSLSFVGVSVPSSEDEPSPPEPETTDGNGEQVPGQSGATPGHSGEAPGQSGVTPGHSAEVPGQSGATPGQSSEAPGQSGDAPGRSGSAPGQSGATPGHSSEAPGQSGDAPGRSGSAPGQSSEPPGQSGDAPGQSDKRSEGSAKNQASPRTQSRK